MSERGISLIALIITIIIIIILATIMGFYSNDVLEKSERMKIESDLRNVDELVSIYKAKIMAGEIQIPDSYLASSRDIDDYLKSDTSIRSKVKNSNKNYYLMNQTDFNEVFAGDVNVKNVKGKFLVNFEDKVVILDIGGKVYVTGEIE